MASLLAVVTYCKSIFPPHASIYTGIEIVGKNINKQCITETVLKVRCPKYIQ
jgi:hypothetical protein